MRFSSVVLILLLVVPSFSVASETTLIRTGFGTGERYLSASEQEQRAYAAGIINGMLMAPMFGASRGKMRWLEQCIQGMTDSQIVSILTKYLRDNPGRWHETPHAPMYTALKESCSK